MVNQREPPRLDASTPSKPVNPVLNDRTNQLEFGKASPLRNPLKSGSMSLFNVPRTRPEHHRPTQTSSRPPPPSTNVNPVFRMPSFTLGGVDSTPSEPSQRPIGASASSHSANAGVHRSRPDPDKIINLTSSAVNSPSLIEVSRPAPFAPRAIPAAPRPNWSSSVGFQPANVFRSPKQKDDDDDFDPDNALLDTKFAEADPYDYVDAGQASENIKALLEGAFEDDDDKPKTRLRKKKQDEATSDLADQLAGLKVDAKQEKVSDEAEEDEEDDGTVEGLKVKLLPHQIDGVSWMMDREIGGKKKNGVLPKGGILADDMGLGKTIQALSLILSNPRPAPAVFGGNPKMKVPKDAGRGTLVVAPLALIKQWEAEIKDKVLDSHKLKVLVHHGPSRTKRFEDLKKYDVVITTYQTLTSEHDGSSTSESGLQVGCFGIHWYRVVLDEAHSIKNKNAKMTKAACALKSVYRWCLTGTPMQNNLDELQSLIHFLRIKPYCEWNSWKAQIAEPMKKGRGGLAIKRLQYFLKALMKRRTKAVLQKEGGLNFGKGSTTGASSKNTGFKIVGRKVETVVCEFDGNERDFYDKLAARTEKSLESMMGGAKTDYIGALVLLLRLRQTCNHRELIKGNLRKEKESFAPVPSGTQTPRKGKASAVDDLDDIADMFGGLTVESKKCDVCQSALNKSEIASGAIRCSDCDGDIRVADKKVKINKHVSKPVKVMKKEVPTTSRRWLHGRRIIDSEDEEEDDGDWIVPNSQQKTLNLGKAGGSEDEDAEGGGEDLGSDDSDTDDEGSHRASAAKPKRSRKGITNEDSFIEKDDSFFDDAEGDDDEGSETSTEDDTSLIPSSKIRQLLKILDKESDNHKFIVFSEFTSMLDLIEPFLARAGLRFVRYDGKMKNDDREESLRSLRENPDTRILLCSLRCGSLGLNLTVASRVVILEPFWNPFVEEQAIDRVHRLNQTQDVVVYRLTIADSVEERILALQEKKRELANAAIEGGKAVGKLGMNDILKLFGRDAEHSNHHEDSNISGVVTGLSQGLLQRQGALQVSPAKKPTTPGGSNFQQAALQRQREREKAAFKVPPTLSPQFDSAYGRRW